MKGISLSTRTRRWILLGTVLFLGVAVRVSIESSTAYQRGESAAEAGEKEAAVFHFRSAAQWYLPGLPSNGAALDRLEEMGGKAEESCEQCPPGCGEVGRDGCGVSACEQCVFALHIYDSIRSAIMGSRSFYTPHADRLQAVNDRLPRVLSRARESHPNGPRTGIEDRAEQERFYRERLARDHAPDPLVGLIASLSFLGWIVGMFLAIWKGMPGVETIARKPLFRWGSLSLLCFFVWIGSLFAL